jgi:alpha-L-arabinofuranosidase
MQRITDGTTEMLGNYVPNKIVANRWYDIRLDIHGARVQGYIDGKLVVESAQLPTPRLAVTSGKLDDGTVIVKAVNGVDAAVDSSIDLAGGSTTGYTGMATTLTSASPADENSLQTPDKIVPSAQNLSVDSPSFAYRFPAHSVTILRLKAK